MAAEQTCYLCRSIRGEYGVINMLDLSVACLIMVFLYFAVMYCLTMNIFPY
jgi:hypothetical protein